MELTHGRNESGSDMIRVNTSSDEVCILANSGLPDLLDNKCEQDLSENARVMKYIEAMPHTKQSLAAMDSMLLQGSIAHELMHILA